MKRCNVCGREYPDNLSYCTNCGSKLTEAESGSTATGPTENGRNEGNISVAKPKTKSKTWKIIRRVIIAAVIIVAILFLWGSHMMNSTTYMTFNSQGELLSKGVERRMSKFIITVIYGR